MSLRAMIAVLVALALVVGGILHFSSRNSAGSAKLSSLAWMAGCWRGEDDGVMREEAWFAPAGGLMLGMHRDVPHEGAAFFESLRIVDRGDRIDYVARPEGGEETIFHLVERGDRRALFENPDHDFPKTILYRLDRETLRVRIEGEENGRSRREEWSWKRARLEGVR